MNRTTTLLLVLGFLTWQTVTSEACRASPAITVLLWISAFLAIWPIAIWSKLAERPVPMFEVFCLFHLLFYTLPGFEPTDSVDTRKFASFVVCVFLAGTQLVYLVASRPSATFIGLAEQVVRPFGRNLKAINTGFLLLNLWLAYELASFVQIMPSFGSLSRPLHTMFNATGVFAVFYLSYSAGKGWLSRKRIRWLVAALFIWMGQEFCSGYLTFGVSILFLGLFGFFMAASRIPSVAYVVGLLIVVLHAGKGDMRDKYWNMGHGSSGRLNPVEVYSYWIGAGFDRISKPQENPGAVENLLKRASLIGIVERIVVVSPDQKPFLDGATYKQAPLLLVPRFLWPEKPHGGIATTTICIYYGIQSEEQTRTTVISTGQIAEAWANGGWLGVAFACLFFGAVLALATKMTPAGQPSLISIICLERAIDLEHCLAQWFTILCISLFAAALLMFFVNRIMKPKAAHFQGRA